MNETNTYKNWRSVKSNILHIGEYPSNTIVWFSELCPDNTEKPENCGHSVAISIDEFKKNYPNYTGFCYYTQRSLEEKTALINRKNAILGLITAIIMIVITITQLTKEVVASNGMIRNEQCDCEIEDISVSKGKKKVRFKVVYLSQEKRWDFASSSKLTNGQNIEPFLLDYLPKIPNFKSSIGLIAVGLASQEGDLKEEEIRASERADAILSSFRVLNFSNSKEFYKLNLGQYLPKEKLDKNETAYQRRVIIIGIMEKNKSMKVKTISKKLKVALEDSERLNFETGLYSKYEFGKF